MRKSKNATPVADPTSVGTQLGAIAADLASIPTLSGKDRRLLAGRSRRVPDALIELVLQLAETNGGQVAGLPIDVTAARATLTRVSASRVAADAARRIASQMDDDSTQQRIVVADRVFAIYAALRRLVNTPEGESFARVHEEMASVVRSQVRPRRAKATAKPASPAPQNASSSSASSQSASKPAVIAPAAATTSAVNPSLN